MKSPLAPIVLFVYNRLWHTEQTVTALLKNELADSSALIIYSDAPKNEAAAGKVEEVRRFVKSIHGFKSVSIIEREKNWGLADNIIDGVTAVVNKYGRVIVLEDDIVTSPFFLRFMNDALDFYEHEEKVGSVSGITFPINSIDLGDVYFTKASFCWGWATWKRAWKFFRRDPDHLLSIFTQEMITDFNYGNTLDFFSQIEANQNGSLRTWAVFWYATLFLNQMLTVCPKTSFSQNIGHDGSGVHCGKSRSFEVELSEDYFVEFESEVDETLAANKALMVFFKSLTPPFWNRVKNKLFYFCKKLASVSDKT